MKTVGICFVQTLQRVKVNRLPGEQRGFYKCTAGGQNKISFSNFTAGLRLVEIARKIRKLRVRQRKGSETTSTGIAPTGSSESASRFVAGLLKPRFTYPSAISFPRRWLHVALVTQPASFPDAEGATSFIPDWSGVLFKIGRAHV